MSPEVDRGPAVVQPGRGSAQRRALSPAFVLFGLFFLLSLLTPAWRLGPFSWFPVYDGALAGRPARVGLLAFLLPLAVLAALVPWSHRLLAAQRARPWAASGRRSGGRKAMNRLLSHIRAGPWQVGLPVAGLGFLMLLRLRPAAAPGVALIVVVGMGLFVMSYLWLARSGLHGVRGLAAIFGAITAVQGTLGLVQFVRQGSVGLDFLGEPSLDLMVARISVVGQPGEHVVRAYGLTAHPNLLGGLLAVGLMWVIGGWLAAAGPTRIVWLLVLLAGLSGLLLSFSRGAWLGFAAGLTWLVWQGRGSRRGRVGIVALMVAAVVLLAWREPVLLWTRLFDLTTPLEAQSLQERLRYLATGIAIIRQHPWLGVGSGLYSAALPAAAGSGAVHNSFLLATAELGLGGGLLWLWLHIAWWPLSRPPRQGARATGDPYRHVVAACWITLLVVGLFDNYTWLTTSWRAALLAGALAGSLAAGNRPDPTRRSG